MNCIEFEDVINGYIDNELSDDDSLSIKKHMEECEECKNIYNDYKEISLLLSDLEEKELPDDFTEELHVKLVKEKREMKIIPFYKNIKVIASVAAVFLISVMAVDNMDLFRMGSDRGSIENSELSVTKSVAMADYSENVVSDSNYVDAGAPTIEAEYSGATDDAQSNLRILTFEEETPVIYRSALGEKITTYNEISLEINGEYNDVIEYLNNKNIEFELYENSSSLSLYIKNKEIDIFKSELSIEYSILSDVSIDHVNYIKDMELAISDYKKQIEDAQNKEDIERLNLSYEQLKDNLNEIIKNSDLIKVNIYIINKD